MKFQAERIIAVSESNLDPASNSIPVEQILTTSGANSFGDDSPSRVVLVLDAPASESITVDLFGVIEHTTPIGETTDGLIAGTRMVLLASAVVIAGRTAITRDCFVPGPIYARLTANTVSVARKLRASCVR